VLSAVQVRARISLAAQGTTGTIQCCMHRHMLLKTRRMCTGVACWCTKVMTVHGNYGQHSSC
jgi:hypothetical protein